jgi:transcriptional regulator with XRE-family HTH domain
MTRNSSHAERAAVLLRRTRCEAGLSLREVAEAAGTSHATLSAYETGRKVPSVATFFRVLEACGVAADIVTSRRIRRRDGIERGEELAAVLRLAEQFPVQASRHLDYPKLPKSPRELASAK